VSTKFGRFITASKKNSPAGFRSRRRRNPLGIYGLCKIGKHAQSAKIFSAKTAILNRLGEDFYWMMMAIADAGVYRRTAGDGSAGNERSGVSRPAR
jgi:hypothetical protein